ncbi:uncharacterized protein LOC134196399 isoform X2 [Corticium candelabrum]|uniref:uncharacterized protein LOC134196399 isoform X2 n=1 Tax=Corticium candelabrum TaxID=121492 RepID=UPI002E26E6D7|nr:uncharacterized protein LOC134196399 isoform X2 [Corticium candelabrum]
MKTPFSAVVLLFIHQVFFTSASDMQIGDRSRWKSFGAELEEVTFTDGQMRLAAVCDHGAQMDGECCSTSDYIPINPTKGYEFSIYIKSTAADMVNSFGFYVYNKNQERILNPNLNNPYFKNSDNDSNVWTKWTGYILPLYMSDSNSDSQSDSQFDETNGVDWKWPRDAKYVALRFGSYGSDSQNSKKVFVRRHAGHTLWAPFAISDSVEPATDESNTVPPTPTSPPPDTPAVDKTWYLNVSFRELEAERRPEHVVVWTFNVSDFREWESKPNDTDAHNTHAAIAKMVEGKERKCYSPWGVTHPFEIDSDKSYEFSVWIKSTQSDLHNFFGFRAYDKDKNPLTFPLLSSDYLQYYSNVTTKAYFKRSNNDTNEWTRWNGFVLPDGADDIFSHLKGRNWVWPRGAKYAQLRFGTCYGKGNDQDITYFALPLVVQTDF